jgi:hypothetical protein
MRALLLCKILLFALIWFLYSFSHQGARGGSHLSRLNALRAICLHGTFSIDAYHENTFDKALFRGHYYSDKAPGTLLLSLPAFYVGALLLSSANWDAASAEGSLFLSWFTTALSVGLLAAIGAPFLFLWLRGFVSDVTAVVTTLAVFIGGLSLPYATMCFSHSVTISLISIIMFLGDLGGKKALPPQTSLFLGILSGFVISSEFTSGIVIIGLIISFWSRLRNKWLFAVGAGLTLGITPLYSWICFGSPLSIGYSYTIYDHMQSGIFGVGIPNSTVLGELLLGGKRGLFRFCPFLMAAWIALPFVPNQRRSFVVGGFAMVFLHCVIISGYSLDWVAGDVIGPRYLSPVLPILALPVAMGIQNVPIIGFVLCSYSIVLMSFCTLLNGKPPAAYAYPLGDFYLPLLYEGEYTFNLVQLLGFRGHESVVPYFAILIIGAYALVRLCSHDRKAMNARVVVQQYEDAHNDSNT